MPQLAPLNWVFLFIIFWMMVFMIKMMFWWMKDKKFYISFSTKSLLESKKWMW